MTIYIKVGAVGCSQVLYKTVRIYETNVVLLDQWHQTRCQWNKLFIFFYLCLWQCICITQKPHDHLYKKSGQCGVAKFYTRLHVRIYETNEVLLDQWHQTRCQWGKLFIFFYLCLWQCICITQKPHDHLYKKSGQWGIAKFWTRL